MLNAGICVTVCMLEPSSFLQHRKRNTIRQFETTNLLSISIHAAGRTRSIWICSLASEVNSCFRYAKYVYVRFKGKNRWWKWQYNELENRYQRIRALKRLTKKIVLSKYGNGKSHRPGASIVPDTFTINVKITPSNMNTWWKTTMRNFSIKFDEKITSG